MWERWQQQACTTMFSMIPTTGSSERPSALLSTMIGRWECLRAQRHRVGWDVTDGRNGGADRTMWETLPEMERLVYGFLKPPDSEREWQVRMHGACNFPFDVLGITHTDQSCHHEVWSHLLHVHARLVDRVSRDDRSRRLDLKKRNLPYDHSKERRRAS